MYTYFVSDDNKAYYRSPMFGRMLSYLQINPRRVTPRERNGRRSFIFSGVGTVSDAVAILDNILLLPVVE